MSNSVFTKIRLGEMPGEVLYSDDTCFVILSISPNNPGHMLLIPIEEVADWQEIKPEVFSHMMGLAQKLGKITKKIYNPPKIGLSCVGFEVPHVHIHIFSLFPYSKCNQMTPDIGMRTEMRIAYTQRFG